MKKNFIQKLRILLSKGLDLIESLKILEKYYNKKEALKIQKCRLKLEKGFSISISFREIMDDEYFLSMLIVAEKIGNLDKVLEVVAKKYEFEADLKKSIYEVMMYPLIVFFLSIILVIFLNIFIIPKFQEMYNSLGKELPFITILLLRISEYIRKRVLFLVIYFILLVIIIKFILKKNKFYMDKFLFKIEFFKNIEILKFSIYMLSSLEANLDFVESLKLSMNISNIYFKSELKKIYFKISKGEIVSNAFANDIFNSEIKSYIYIGEKSGDMLKSFYLIKENYEIYLREKMKYIFKVLEPLLIILVASLIGVIIFAMMSPIFNMGDNLVY